MAGTDGRAATATVLFTDLAGSTEIRAALGDDAADALRREHDHLIGQAVAAAGGTQVKGTGDGVMAVFGSASDAVSAAVTLQQSLHRFNRRAPVPLAVRVGISAGDVSWDGDDYFGTPVVEANRLCDTARPGAILAAEVVRILAGSRGDHRFVPTGTLTLKGLGDVAAYEVVWEPPADAATPLPAALVPQHAAPYVGREDERAALRAAWKEVASGRRRVVLVSGEPGMGKTRLAAELAAEVFEDGATVLFGRCDEDLGVPYQPFVEALRTAIAALPDDRLAEVVGDASDLARALPQLAARLPGLEEPVRADPDTERYRLFEAIDGVLARLAGSGPVLLVVDDLHWAAKPTLLLLRHLVRSDAVASLLVLGTYRDTDLDRGHPLSDALAELRREATVERIALRGLSSDDVTELVGAIAGHELDDAGLNLALTVHGETDGNPFFVSEVLRHLAESGAIVQRNGRWVAGGGTIGIPEGVREVIGRRLSRLSQETNEVLAAAAVVGREFDTQLVADVARVDIEVVFDALDEAERARLVHVVPEHSNRFTFAHALVRTTLYDEVPTTRRLRLHRRAGEALEARTGGRSRLDELARHFAEAAALGDVDRAVRYITQAADEAVVRTAYEKAAEYFDQALQILDPDDPGSERERSRILIGLGKVRRQSGEAAVARSALMEAADIGHRLGDGQTMARAALELHGRRAWSDAGDIDHELVQLLEDALALLPEEDSGIRAAVTARLASELYFLQEEFDRRRAMTADSIAMARRVGDRESLAFVLSCATWGLWVPFNSEERLALAKEAVALAHEMGDLALEGAALSWAPSCYAELGDRARFDECVASETELRDRMRDVGQEWVTEMHLSTAALLDGRVEEFVNRADAALALGSRTGMSTPAQLYGVQQLAHRRLVGGIEELVPLVQSMVDQFPLLPSWRTGLLLLARDLGDLDAARESYDWFAKDDFRSLPRDANWPVGMGILAFGAHALGDRDGAPVLYEMLVPYEDFGITVGIPADVLCSVHLPLALLAETMGRIDEADERLPKALAFVEQFGNVPWLALTLIEQARALQRWGRHADAAAAAGQALDIAQRHEMPRLVQLATELTGSS